MKPTKQINSKKTQKKSIDLEVDNMEDQYDDEEVVQPDGDEGFDEQEQMQEMKSTNKRKAKA